MDGSGRNTPESVDIGGGEVIFPPATRPRVDSNDRQNKELTKLRKEMQSLRTEFSVLTVQMERLTHLLTGSKLGGQSDMLEAYSQSLGSNAYMLNTNISFNRTNSDSSAVKELFEKRRQLEEHLISYYPHFKNPPGYIPQPISQM